MDLNRQLININEKTVKIKDDLLGLLRDYEALFHEANGIYLNERFASNNEGLDDFYMLLQIIRRNRDLVGSMFKGLTGLRPTERFRFVEEDVPEKPLKKEKKTKKYIEVPVTGEETPIEDLFVKEPEVTNG